MKLKDLKKCSKICKHWQEDYLRMTMFDEAMFDNALFWSYAETMFNKIKNKDEIDEYILERMSAEIIDKASASNFIIDQLFPIKEEHKYITKIRDQAIWFKEVLQIKNTTPTQQIG